MRRFSIMSSSRRDFLKAVAAVGGTSVSNGALLAKYSEPANSAATDEQTRPPFRLIWEGEWNDIPCTDYPLTPERWAEEAMAPLVNTHVDALAYNLCSSDGYVCDLK